MLEDCEIDLSRSLVNGYFSFAKMFRFLFVCLFITQFLLHSSSIETAYKTKKNVSLFTNLRYELNFM